MDAIGPLLSSHQSGTILRLDTFEKDIRGILQPLENNVKNLVQGQDSIQKTLVESNTALLQTLVAHSTTMKNILARVRNLEGAIGKHREGDENTISDKLDAVNYSMGELLERALDPYAAVESVQKHDMAIATNLIPEPRPSDNLVRAICKSRAQDTRAKR
ncbi:hypothetical protein BT96DRAFT_34195 [Gymnopus androsaceus JB14]|uniref:Uncharacterized protein n=1 Tax=Gymnopus androsaceus JB14 TaxID=1447944 RepID=A0A6A4GDG2_9AGAR|nr:hypothetical protein BT96DRAFT_34195 [Gymnopus androsaceus JB14]